MQVTFFSFVMSILWSSIIIISISLFRKKRFFIQQFGIASILFVYFLGMIRVLFPVDLPFSKGIYDKGFFSHFYAVFYLKKIRIAIIDISLWEVFLFTWFAIAFFLLIRLWIDYKDAISDISAFEEYDVEYCKKTLAKVKSVTKKNINIKVLCSDKINVPIGIGIVNKVIILPKERYDPDMLYYILLHEYTHFINRDLLTKFLIKMSCCIFWWNPVVYLLKKDLEQTLEMKCDLSVTDKMNKSEKVQYLKSILYILENIEGAIESQYNAVGLIAEKDNVVERFQMVVHRYSSGGGWILKIGLFMFAGMLMVCSYLFVVQPSYDAPQKDIEEAPGILEVTSDNSYILTENGKYFLISETECIEISEELALQMISEEFELKRGEIP